MLCTFLEMPTLTFGKYGGLKPKIGRFSKLHATLITINRKVAKFGCQNGQKCLTLWTLASLHVGCTANPERSPITYHYQYQYRFFGSLNSGNYYISPTYHIYCSLLVPCIPPFLSQNLIFWLYTSSTLSITSSEYRYLHIHWISPPYFLRKILHRVQKPVSKLHVMPKLNRLELSTCDLSVAWYFQYIQEFVIDLMWAGLHSLPVFDTP